MEEGEVIAKRLTSEELVVFDSVEAVSGDCIISIG